MTPPEDEKMTQSARSRLVLGLLLILLGIWFLAARFYPQLDTWIHLEFTWPMIVIFVGAFLLAMGLFVGAPGMAVPACIVSGIGGILYWQNLTGRWETWSFAWALIPGFVGVGILLSALLGGEERKDISGGFGLIFISLILFIVFGNIFGQLGVLGQYWPVLLILLGIWMLVRSFFRRRS